MRLGTTNTKASRAKDDSAVTPRVGSVAATIAGLLSSISTLTAAVAAITSTPSMNVQIFTSGSTFNIAASTNKNILAIIKPASLLATGTIQLPGGSFDGQRVVFKSLQIITLLSLTTASGTIQDTIATLALAGFAEYAWSSADSKWYKIG